MWHLHRHYSGSSACCEGNVVTDTNLEASLDPTMLGSWIQVLPDNTISVRTGVADFGQGTVATVFRQLVAEELRVAADAISEMVTGDTDRTHDGGIAAAIMSVPVQLDQIEGLGVHPGSPFGRQALNVQKVAAYAYGELLERASKVFDAHVDNLTAVDGVISSGSRSITYAELVCDSPLDVLLEVTHVPGFGVIVLGSPPVVPTTQYRVLGTSTPNPRIPPIVTATSTWVGSIRLPGMVHGRVVHPRTLGSTLVSVGSLPADQYPLAEVVVRGDLVGVVSPDEWDAICAAQALAETTVWRDWVGLPRSDRLIEAMFDIDWSTAPVNGSSSDPAGTEATLAASPRKLDASYALPFYKHAPISPEITVADVRGDGTVHLWCSSQHPQGLRVKIATMLGTDPANVVVHLADGGGGFGRTNKGDGGSEAEAVLLSQACGRPVRLQWMREDDFAWSAQQAAYLGEVSVALDEAGHMAAVKVEHHHPGDYNDPLLGALLAGLPSQPADWKPSYINWWWIEWPYDRVPHHFEVVRGAPAIGQQESPINLGLRTRSMRSPQHLQQNFAVECMVNEAAAAAGADSIQYRLDHTTDRRLIGVLELVRDMSGWETRPSPAERSKGEVVRGRGVGVAIRHGSYFASVAEIAVDLNSGGVTAERYWLAADVGIVVNPRQLRLNLEGGTMMGISQVLHEELQFNASAITSTNFKRYPILTMAEIPEIEIEIIDRPDENVGQGSEPVNMLPPVALAAAFFDATGTPIRKLPMRPEYVLAELRDG
jgi:nicotinate dehydrogenase subunit B